MIENQVNQEAREIVRLVVHGLNGLGLAYHTKDGRLQSVRIARVIVPKDRLSVALEVDTRRLPRGVSVPDLVSPRTVHHLSGVVQKPVHVINSTGVTYLVLLAPMKRKALPKRVFLNVDARPGENFMLPLGMTASGELWKPLQDLLHVLIGGSTGGGKSTLLHSFILSLISNHAPQDVSLFIIDPKVVDFSIYENVPHVKRLETEPDRSVDVLTDVMEELYRRKQLFASAGVRHFDRYLAEAGGQGFPKLPVMIVIIDELGVLMEQSKRGTEGLLSSLTAQGRAFGIHVIAATQFPNRDVLGGLAKANFVTRIAFRVPDNVASRVVLGVGGAEKLPAIRGRYLLSIGARTWEVQGFMVTDGMIEYVLNKVGVPKSFGTSTRELSDVERVLVEYAVTELDGAFKINALFEWFRPHISKDTIQRVARRFEAMGLLTKPAGPTKPRMVTERLVKLLSEASEHRQGRDYVPTRRHVDTPDTPDASDTGGKG